MTGKASTKKTGGRRKEAPAEPLYGLPLRDVAWGNVTEAQILEFCEQLALRICRDDSVDNALFGAAADLLGAVEGVRSAPRRSNGLALIDLGRRIEHLCAQALVGPDVAARRVTLRRNRVNAAEAGKARRKVVDAAVLRFIEALKLPPRNRAAAAARKFGVSTRHVRRIVKKKRTSPR